MDCLEGLSGEEMVIISSLIGVFLANGKTVDEIDVLGNVFTLIGETMLTIAARKAQIEGEAPPVEFIL